MPRKPGKVPAYCHHKASGRAVVRIDGHDHYLGPYGSAESRAVYERLVAEWRARRQQSAVDASAIASISDPSLTLSAVLLRYRTFAEGYYVKDGKPTKELEEMRLAVKPIRELYGETLAREFGPLKLKAVQQHLIKADLSRNVINHRVNRINRIFKWAVSEQLIPPSVYALSTRIEQQGKQHWLNFSPDQGINRGFHASCILYQQRVSNFREPSSTLRRLSRLDDNQTRRPDAVAQSRKPEK